MNPIEEFIKSLLKEEPNNTEQFNKFMEMMKAVEEEDEKKRLQDEPIDDKDTNNKDETNLRGE